MKTEAEKQFLNKIEIKVIGIIFFTVILILVFFKNKLFESSFILKNFGETSVDPEIALANDRPSFFEFYAEWCEVCKEMAPKISQLRETYGDQINFVFLNVDNAQWEKYIKEFNVNGIPQINLIDQNGVLKSTLIGRHDENIIKDQIDSLSGRQEQITNFEDLNFSRIKKTENLNLRPMSHG